MCSIKQEWQGGYFQTKQSRYHGAERGSSEAVTVSKASAISEENRGFRLLLSFQCILGTFAINTPLSLKILNFGPRTVSQFGLLTFFPSECFAQVGLRVRPPQQRRRLGWRAAGDPGGGREGGQDGQVSHCGTVQEVEEWRQVRDSDFFKCIFCSLSLFLSISLFLLSLLLSLSPSL